MHCVSTVLFTGLCFIVLCQMCYKQTQCIASLLFYLQDCVLLYYVKCVTNRRNALRLYCFIYRTVFYGIMSNVLQADAMHCVSTIIIILGSKRNFCFFDFSVSEIFSYQKKN